MNYLLFAISICLGFLMGYVYQKKGIPFSKKWKTPFVQMRNELSIGIGFGNSLEEIQNNCRCILTRHDVHDVQANLVADPFLFHKSTWFMFMEVVNKPNKLGEIGLATSKNGINWHYQSIVLKEPFHLSYPYVFEDDDTVWMIPETKQDNSVRLYRAIDFPKKWKLENILIEGKPYADSSVFKHQDLWWMFTTLNHCNDLLLYFSEHLTGPWQMHPQSPIAYFDPKKARCAGRVINYDGNLIRFAQNCKNIYGESVLAYRIDYLDKKSYIETELYDKPILYANDEEWRSQGMHHLDLHPFPGESKFIAAVDGRKKIREFGIRY